MANRYIAVSCAVSDFVEAAAISGPALVYSAPRAMLAIVESTALQTAMVLEPRSCSRICEASVSAVSPDLLIRIESTSSSTIGSL